MSAPGLCHSDSVSSCLPFTKSSSAHCCRKSSCKQDVYVYHKDVVLEPSYVISPYPAHRPHQSWPPGEYIHLYRNRHTQKHKTHTQATMSGPLRPTLLPQCTSCIRRTTRLGLQEWRPSQHQQVRGKKKLANIPNSVTVRLLKDVQTFGRKGIALSTPRSPNPNLNSEC